MVASTASVAAPSSPRSSLARTTRSNVTPATLASTFVTSIAGVVTFVALTASRHGPVAPDWGVGIALGVGGLAGAYTGARLQPRLPETVIRRVPGCSSSPSVSATPPSSADL